MLEQYTCEICENFFYRKYYFKIQKGRSHSNVKPFQCELCEKMSSCKLLLKEHFEYHVAEKKIACDECPKGFKMKSGLISV